MDDDGLDVVVKQTNRYHNSRHDFQKGTASAGNVIIIPVVKPR
jgi:hypothetical protein